MLHCRINLLTRPEICILCLINLFLCVWFTHLSSPHITSHYYINRSGRLAPRKHCAGRFTSTTSTASMDATPTAMSDACGPSVSGFISPVYNMLWYGFLWTTVLVNLLVKDIWLKNSRIFLYFSPNTFIHLLFLLFLLLFRLFRLSVCCRRYSWPGLGRATHLRENSLHELPGSNDSCSVFSSWWFCCFLINYTVEVSTTVLLITLYRENNHNCFFVFFF